MADKLYYIIRCKDGEPLRSNGLFCDNGSSCKVKPYKRLDSAKILADFKAGYMHERIRVDDEEGNTVYEVGDRND